MTVPKGRFSPGLHHRLVLGAGLLLAALGAALVWAGTAAIDRRAFESMRQRGLFLARLVALAAGDTLETARSGGLVPLVDRLAGDPDLAYVEIVDRDGAVLATGGAEGRRPVYAARGVPLVPAGRDDRVRGVSGEPLYVFSFPIQVAAPGEPPFPGPDAPGGSGFGPRSAGAAPRGAGAAGARAHALTGEVRVAFSAAAL
ncbi:MAG: hypothetical protein AAB297_09190, partial [Acidobacteriota bacterium]